MLFCAPYSCPRPSSPFYCAHRTPLFYTHIANILFFPLPSLQRFIVTCLSVPHPLACPATRDFFLSLLASHGRLQHALSLKDPTLLLSPRGFRLTVPLARAIMPPQQPLYLPAQLGSTSISTPPPRRSLPGPSYGQATFLGKVVLLWVSRTAACAPSSPNVTLGLCLEGAAV